MSETTQNFDAAFEQIRQSYLESCVEKFSLLESASLALEKNENTEENLQLVLREIHSLKGSAGTFGFQFLSEMAHQIEDFIETALQGADSQAKIGSYLLAITDLLRQVLASIHSQNHDFSFFAHEMESLQKSIKLSSHNRVMIIESSDTMFMSLTQTLKEFPLHVFREKDGYIALRRLLSEKFDLLISSAQTGLLDSKALLSALHNSEQARSKSIFSIIITSNPNGSAPADVCLQKNADLAKKLHETIENFIKRPRQ